MSRIERGAGHTTPAEIAAIAAGAPVTVAPAAMAGVAETFGLIDALIDGPAPIYGLTTGVGDLHGMRLSRDAIAQARLRMLRSHASGQGRPHPPEVVRAIMACQLRRPAIGVSGVSPALPDTLAETLAAMLGRGVTSWAPAGGSGGHLIATADIGLVVHGHGRAWSGGTLMDGAEALARAGIWPPEIAPRGGLTLMRGTYEIIAIGALALERALELVAIADLAELMGLEARRGNTCSYDPRLQALRPHLGQAETAARLSRLAAGSEIFAAHRDHRLQDALSLRCIPQVHGAVRDTLDQVERVLTTEINAITDNPVFLRAGAGVVAIPGGNGHGAPVAAVMDHLAIALSGLCSISQARSERSTNATLSGPPAFLSEGADSGLMTPPYVAAALVAENRALAMLMSVHSIPTCAGQEDHVSMGAGAALQALQAGENLVSILAVELLCGLRALACHAPLRPGAGTGAAAAFLAERVGPRDPDRDIHRDLGAIGAVNRDGSLQVAVDSATATAT